MPVKIQINVDDYRALLAISNLPETRFQKPWVKKGLRFQKLR